VADLIDREAEPEESWVFDLDPVVEAGDSGGRRVPIAARWTV